MMAKQILYYQVLDAYTVRVLRDGYFWQGKASERDRKASRGHIYIEAVLRQKVLYTSIISLSQDIVMDSTASPRMSATKYM